MQLGCSLMEWVTCVAFPAACLPAAHFPVFWLAGKYASFPSWGLRKVEVMGSAVSTLMWGFGPIFSCLNVLAILFNQLELNLLIWDF